MAKVKVRLADNIARVVFLDTDATNGAKLGANLFLPDGSIASPAALAAYIGVSSTSAPRATAHRLLAGLTVGDDHPQYTRKDTLTTRGDLYVKGPTVVQRLAMGTAKQLLRVNNGGTDPAWATLSPVITLGNDLGGSVTLTDLASGTLNATIQPQAVSYAKIQNISATSRILGRATAGAGSTEELTGVQVRSISNAYPAQLSYAGI